MSSPGLDLVAGSLTKRRSAADLRTRGVRVAEFAGVAEFDLPLWRSDEEDDGTELPEHERWMYRGCRAESAWVDGRYCGRAETGREWECVTGRHECRFHHFARCGLQLRNVGAVLATVPVRVFRPVICGDLTRRLVAARMGKVLVWGGGVGRLDCGAWAHESGDGQQEDEAESN